MSAPLAQFPAIFSRLTTEKHGDTKIVFEISSDQLPEAAKLNLGVEKLLIITVDLAPTRVIGQRGQP